MGGGRHGDSDGDEDLLCNTMVVTGPHGVGKTAMVYAVAHELGYKVNVHCIFSLSAFCYFVFLSSVNYIVATARDGVCCFCDVCLSVCMSVRTRNSKTIAPIDLMFYTQEVLCTWLGPPFKIIRIGIGSALKNLFKDSSPLRDAKMRDNL